MSTKPKKSTRAVLTGILLDDPWRKLASIALAVLLWQYLDDQVSEALDLEVVMTPATKSDDLTWVEPKSLVLRLDLNRYSVMGYENARTKEPVSQIELKLNGRRHLIKEIPQSGVFQVSLEPTQASQGDFAEFEVADIAPVNPSFQGMLRDISPSRVRVQLSRNQEIDVQVNRDRILVEAPEGDPSFEGRLRWDDAVIQPGSVKIRGPEKLVRELSQKLWVLDAKSATSGVSKISQTLRLNLGDGRLVVTPATVKITVPLMVPPSVYKLTNVPVVLSAPGVRDSFELVKDTADIDIVAVRNLDGHLHGRKGEALRRWLSEKRATIWAKLPANPQDSGVITQPTLSLDGYIEGRDFHVEVAPSINYRRKQR